MKELLNLLKNKNLTLGSIESMTGGLFASDFCSNSGASSVFKGSVVTYTREIKEQVVGVRKETIDRYGVVSKEVANEMAEKGQKLLNVDVAISVTGNAGPTCEPGGQPVGSVYISIFYNKKLYSKHLSLQGSRSMIQLNTVIAMKNFISETIFGNV